jgi:hypothetical protein
MALWYFATSPSTQHVAHDTPTLPMTTEDVAPGAFYAFPDTLLPPPAVFSNTHYTVNANQSGDSPGLAYIVPFVCTPVSTGAFRIGFYNLTGETIPAGTVFTVAFTCVGE